jgi:hypothetical protein
MMFFQGLYVLGMCLRKYCYNFQLYSVCLFRYINFNMWIVGINYTIIHNVIYEYGYFCKLQYSIWVSGSQAFGQLVQCLPWLVDQLMTIVMICGFKDDDCSIWWGWHWTIVMKRWRRFVNEKTLLKMKAMMMAMPVNKMTIVPAKWRRWRSYG